MYAKLENNKLTYAPKNYKTGEHLIINFNKNETLMKKYGFKEVIDNKPNYDNSTHYLSVKDYTEDENAITINYTINEIEVNQEPTLEERIVELENKNKAQDVEIALNQEAINYMLFASTTMSLSEQEKTKSSNVLAPYLANQILKGRLDYTLVTSRYEEFKADIDTILIAEGKQDLIK